MRILVCISSIPDTTTKIKITADNKQIDYEGVQWIINPWDELTLTRAIELKEESDSTIQIVDVVNVGTSIADTVLKKCLAIGADKAFRINSEAKDAKFTAIQLAKFIKTNSYDLIICGIESSDFNGSSVGVILSEKLDIPLINSVSGIKIDKTKTTVNAETPNESLTLQIEKFPVLLIIQKGFALEPRIPNLKGIIQARRKPLQIIEPLDEKTELEYLEFYHPKPKGEVKLVDEDNLHELINLLSTEAKVL